MNIFYKNRYNKFIESIKAKGHRTFDNYTETHHIVPRCLRGPDSPDNLIRLTLREHFLAHWLLWKAYPTYLPLASAFLQMNNKNTKLDHKGFQGRITSRTYDKLRTEVYDLIKEHTVGWVYVKDKTGKTLKLKKEEYESQSDLYFHTKGKVYVLDTIQNVWVYITSAEYQLNKNRYKSRMSLEGFPRSGNPIGNIHGPWNPNAHIDIKLCKYQFIDSETDEIIKITKSEAKLKNQEYGYKRLIHIQKKNVRCIDNDGNTYTIPLSEYNPSVHKFYLAEKINVFDILDNKQKIISLDEYYQNKDRYLTSTKGKVLAKDSSGNRILVTKEEFKSGNYVGQTKGLRTVKDADTGKFVQITENEFKTNKSKYIGPNKGRVNVIDKQTGERKQIPKEQFNTKQYCGLGNKKFLFLCLNKLTTKQKLINIYEWDLVKDHYEIIDYEKYVTALNSK